MATCNEVIARMKARLARQGDSSISTRIVLELQAAQERLEGGVTLPWFLNVQASTTVSGAHDTFSLSLFPRFLRIAEDDYGLRVEDTSREDETLVKLFRKDTYEQLIRWYPGTADSITFPEAYCVLGTTVHVRKKQSVSRTYYLSFFQKDETLPDADVTTLWTTNLPLLLEGEAGIHVAQYLRDKESLNYYMGLKNAGYAEMIRRNQALQDADQNYVMGD